MKLNIEERLGREMIRTRGKDFEEELLTGIEIDMTAGEIKLKFASDFVQIVTTKINPSKVERIVVDFD